MLKRLNRSRCHLVCGLVRDQESKESPTTGIGTSRSHIKTETSVKLPIFSTYSPWGSTAAIRPLATRVLYWLWVDPPCPLPAMDHPPANGALVCGTLSHYYPRVCRVHCRRGYELRRHDAQHKFVCQWDGTWTIDGPWPDCYCTCYIHIQLLAHVAPTGRCF